MDLVVKYFRYVAHGIWISTNEKVTNILFYVMRVTLEYLFVLKVRGLSVKSDMKDQVEQTVLFYMQRYVTVVNKQDGGIRPLCEIEQT